jgi:hypothetical protein
MIFAIDFDGTAVTHDYPEVGKYIGAQVVLKELVSRGHQLVLFTMRSGKELQDAVDWYKEHGIELWGINVNPQQFFWTTSPKAYANVYIDDAALNAPLCFDPNFHSRPFVDWITVAEKLENMGLWDYQTTKRLKEEMDFTSLKMD